MANDMDAGTLIRILMGFPKDAKVAIADENFTAKNEIKEVIVTHDSEELFVAIVAKGN